MIADTDICNFRINVPSTFGHYTTQRIVGKGSYSIVITATDNKTGETRACKLVSRKGMMEAGYFHHLEKELRVLQSLNHPNIAKIYDIVYLEDVIIVVMEYCPNGDLLEFVANKNGLQAYEIIQFLKQIL